MAKYIKTEDGYKSKEEFLDGKMSAIDPVGTGSFSMNRKSGTVIGSYSHAEGNGTIASGSYSHAEGSSTYASGSYSHAEGSSTYASGTYSHAEGYSTYASGSYSHAEGYMSRAANDCCHAEGFNTKASGMYQHAEGKHNSEDLYSMYAHIVGNGTGYARSNAHTVDWYGNATFAGTVTGSGADYAEYFEWSDGNPDDEDRVGLIVALDGEKIRLANAKDEILGVVSGTAMVVGDNAEWEWKNRFLMDDYGRVIIEMVEEFHEETDEETGEVVKTSLGLFPHRKLNPDYNPEMTYVRRCDRSEWETIGLFGKLHVTDDGTCVVGGYATVGVNGVATASPEKTNMRVMKRITDNIILVFMK